MCVRDCHKTDIIAKMDHFEEWKRDSLKLTPSKLERNSIYNNIRPKPTG